MEMNILKSGSSGNCIVLTDIKGNQILLDCGIKYSLIVPHIDFANLNFICMSHCH